MHPHAGDLDDLARRAAAAVDADQVVALTRDLVRIPSVYRPALRAGGHDRDAGSGGGGAARGDEAEAASFLAGHLARLSLTVTTDEVTPGRPNVIADWHGGGPGRGLILEGHTDVVTPGDESAWTHPPFAGVLADGRIYGRGSADMKGGLAAAICALDAVRRAAPALPGRVRVAAVVDEEAMMLGIKAFVRGGWAQGFDAAIICEPEENELCLVQKGAMRVLATFRGKMAHGAMPYAGINPITPAALFVARLVEEERRQQAQWGRHVSLGLPHVTATTFRAPIHGEPQFNVMAGEAQVTVDVRTVPGQDHDALLSTLQALALGAAGAEAVIERIEDRPWTETPADAPIVVALERACRAALGRAPRYGGVPGSTDGTILRAWAGLPIVTVGPGDRQIPHQYDEYVDVDELVDAARLYAAAIVYFLGAA
jgi:succinyl-diaminopimelate desuccinylase